MKTTTKTRFLALALALSLILAVTPIIGTALAAPTEWEAAFPDANFRTTVLDVLGMDENDDIDDADFEAITWLIVDNKDIADLTGIEHFTALEGLSCISNNLVEIDIRNNPELVWFSCDENQLTELDISNNTALKELYCYDNRLSELDISKNINLEMLNCSKNRLSELKAGNNLMLATLYCHDNQLTELDVSINTALEDFHCDWNKLDRLDISSNTALYELHCAGNNLTVLDISNNTALINLYCYNNELTKLDISNNTELEVFTCQSNNLTTLDVSNNIALKRLECFDNQLSELDISKNTNFELLHCAGNQLSELDVSKNTALEILYCHDNQLITLDVSNNAVLKLLCCNYNYIISEDLLIGLENTSVDKTGVYYSDYYSDYGTEAPQYVFHPQNVHTVTFKDHDGTTLKTQVVVPGTAATAPADPTRDDYTFDGWDIAFDNVTSDLTVTATYILIDDGDPDDGDPDNQGGNSQGGNDNNQGDNNNQGGGTSATPTPAPTPTPEPTPAPIADPENTISVEAPKGEELAFIPNNTLNQIRQGRLALEVGFTDEDGETLGTVVFSPAAANQMISDATGGGVSVSLALADVEALTPEQAEIVGDRPVYDLRVTDGNDRPITQFGGPVQVSLPYTLQAGENPNGIVVYYVSASGKLETMRGYYDADKKAVVFTTTHFSQYVIAYVPIPYTDIPSDWSKNAIEFIGARGYAVGIVGNKFEPSKDLTRGEFTAALMNAYGIELDPSATDNFSDVDATAPYAAHLATGKKLGLIAGVGGDSYAPERTITRQEMFALLYNILDKLGELPEAGEDGKALSDFTDAEDVSVYLEAAIKALLEAGIMEGDGAKLLPQVMADRAQMAGMIYNLLTR